MSMVQIKGQFNWHDILSTCSSEKVEVRRDDGLNVPYIRDDSYAQSHWNEFCDEVDSSLQALNDAKKTMKCYGPIPIVGLICDLIFVVTYTGVTASRFLFRVNAGSIAAGLVAIYCTATLIVLEYRIRLRCAIVWKEVTEICRTRSNNIAKYRLKHTKLNHKCSKSKIYFIFIDVQEYENHSFIVKPATPEFLETIKEEGGEDNQEYSTINNIQDGEKSKKYQIKPVSNKTPKEDYDDFDINPKTSQKRNSQSQGDEDSETPSETNSYLPWFLKPAVETQKNEIPDTPNSNSNTHDDKINSESSFFDREGFLPGGFLSVNSSEPLTNSMVNIPIDSDKEDKISWHTLGNKFTI